MMMRIFAGSSNRELAEKIAKRAKWEMGEIEIAKFANGEKRVRVMDRGSGQAMIVQSFSAPVDEQVIEFCLIADALARAGYTELIGVVPWLGYSKQDKVFLPGEPLSAKVIAQIIQTTKVKKLVTFDLHNRAITGFFEIPVVELSAKPVFLEYFGSRITDESWNRENTVVVAPDEGAVKASASFARELKVPIAYMDKRRDLVSGKVEVAGMTGEVKDKHVIIVDDMIVTGSTVIQAAKYLKKMGANSVSVAATHHLYVPGAQEGLEESEIDEIVVTDSVQELAYGQRYTANGISQDGKPQFVSRKLKVLTVAGVVVDELG